MLHKHTNDFSYNTRKLGKAVKDVCDSNLTELKLQHEQNLANVDKLVERDSEEKYILKQNIQCAYNTAVYNRKHKLVNDLNTVVDQTLNVDAERIASKGYANHISASVNSEAEKRDTFSRTHSTILSDYLVAKENKNKVEGRESIFD